MRLRAVRLTQIFRILIRNILMVGPIVIAMLTAVELILLCKERLRKTI